MAPQDDPAIPDTTKLYRRVPPDQVVRDQNLGRLRPSTGLFTHYEMSVVLENKMAEDARELESALGPYDEHYLVSIIAEFARSEDQAVASTPSTDPYDEPAHGDVCGDKKRPKSRRKRFATTSAWEIEPPDGFDPPSGG